jgi:hypothetical protein
MVSFIPNEGFFVRLKGDFGMKTCGYRFELLGLLATSMYQIMEKRIFVRDRDGAIWLAPPPAPVPLPHIPDIGSLERESCDLIPPSLRERIKSFQPKHPPKDFLPTKLSGFLRWVDDLMRIFDSQVEAERALHALAFLHRRYGWVIKRSKVRIAPRLPFTGIILDPVFGCMEIPADKRKKYRGIMQPIAARRKMTLDKLESATGIAGWISGILPQLVPFATIFYKQLHALKTPVLVPSPSLARAASIFAHALQCAPRQLATLERSFTMEEADEVIHGDWAGANGARNRPHRIAVVLLSRGLYASMEVPKWFIDSQGPLCPNSGEILCIAFAARTFSSILTGKKVAFCSDSLGLVLRSSHFEAGASGSRAINRAFELGALALVEANTCFVYNKIPRNRNLADPLVNANGSLPEFQRKWSLAGLPGVPSRVKPLFPRRPDYWKRQ